MTDYVRYVTIGADAGGDGTTPALTSGDGTHAYASLSLAEAGLQTEFSATIGAADTLTVICNGTTTPDTTFTWSGWTISGNVYIESDVTTRHDGKYNTSAFRLEAATAMAIIEDNNVELRYLQFKDTSASSISCVVLNGGADGSGVVSCVLYDNTGGSGDTGINLTSSSTPFHIVNNVFDGFPRGIIDSSGSGSIAVIYNNTFANCTNGVLWQSAKTNLPILINNIFTNCTNDTDGFVNSSSDYNTTDNTSLGYTANTNDLVSQTFSFVASGSGDYHLLTTDTGAYALGTDLSADATYPFNFDIDGDTRSATWSRGADEPVSAVPFPAMFPSKQFALRTSLR